MLRILQVLATCFAAGVTIYVVAGPGASPADRPLAWIGAAAVGMGLMVAARPEAGRDGGAD